MALLFVEDATSGTTEFCSMDSAVKWVWGTGKVVIPCAWRISYSRSTHEVTVLRKELVPNGRYRKMIFARGSELQCDSSAILFWMLWWSQAFDRMLHVNSDLRREPTVFGDSPLSCIVHEWAGM